LSDHPLRSRLGRRVVSDENDWDVPKLRAKMAEAKAAQVDPTQTVEQATSGLTSWLDVLRWAAAVWKWLKSLGPKPPPEPPGPPTPPDAPAWVNLIVLDQGNYGTCVGNGWAGWGDATPIADTYLEPDARRIYYEATVIDGWPDDPDAPGGGQQGATVRSGAKAMKNRGKLMAYAWAGSLAEIDDWIDNHGPIVMGTNWYTGMFDTDADGYVHVTGSVEGGHCFLMLDRLPGGAGYLFQNSWGEGWGQGGRFKISTTDLQRLLNEGGEACVAAEIV